MLLDACVLAPPTLRALLFELAKRDVFRPRWSARIEEEWRRAHLKWADGPPTALLEAEIATATARFPDARVAGWEPLEDALTLPDWNDRHVLAAAIRAEADLVLTDNLRDFPKRTLAGHGLRREAADPFLWAIAGAREAQTRAAVGALAEQAGASLAAMPATLKRARLPRFAKAVRRFEA